MSGGVGPSNDIGLPQEDRHEEEAPKHHLVPQHPSSKTPPRFLTFRQLNALAVIIVFSASGMVSLEDFIFVIFSLIYTYLLSKIAFPPQSPSQETPIFTQPNRLLAIYVSIGAIIGLFLPIVYIFHGIFEGDKQGIKAAAPHVFLLSSQVFMEGLTFSRGFSIPVRVFVPVFYNTKRIFSICDWLRSEIWKVEEEFGGSERRVIVGRGLAIVNMAFWCFNLFGFLLPVYLPKAFKRYYGGKMKI